MATKKAKVKTANAKKVLIRPKEGRMLGGVGLALSNYFDLDITLVRLVIAVLTVLMGFGPGLIIYFVSWIIIPSE